MNFQTILMPYVIDSDKTFVREKLVPWNHSYLKYTLAKSLTLKVFAGNFLVTASNILLSL